MFTQCSPRLHVCKSVTHSLMSAGRGMPSETAHSVLPGQWLSAASTALEVLPTQSSAGLTPTVQAPIHWTVTEHLPRANKHCSWHQGFMANKTDEPAILGTLKEWRPNGCVSRHVTGMAVVSTVGKGEEEC